MNDLIISIFGNKIFLEIINELKLFRKSKINFVKDISLLLNGKFDNNYIIIFFINGQNAKELLKIKKLKKPTIVLVPKEMSHINTQMILLNKLICLLK